MTADRLTNRQVQLAGVDAGPAGHSLRPELVAEADRQCVLLGEVMAMTE